MDVGERHRDRGRATRRIRRRRHLRVHLPGEGPHRAGTRVCGTARRHLVPALRGRGHGRQSQPAGADRPAPQRDLDRHLSERAHAAGLPVPGLQRGRRGPHRLRPASIPTSRARARPSPTTSSVSRGAGRSSTRTTSIPATSSRSPISPSPTPSAAGPTGCRSGARPPTPVRRSSTATARRSCGRLGRPSWSPTPPAGPSSWPDNVRVYLFAGTQHGGGPGVHVERPSAGLCQHLSNPLALSQIRVALSLALHDWVARDIAPPTSRFPTWGDGLVPASAVDFPAVPGVTWTGSYNPLHLADHRSMPPMQGDAYTVLVGRTESRRQHDRRRPAPQSRRAHRYVHGLEPAAGGIRGGGPVPRAPGRSSRSRPPRRTAGRRGDPRLSLDERYPDHTAYVRAVSEAAKALVQDRLLLRKTRTRS